MLYTRKGDGGTTCFFGCDQRFSKSSERAEALGAVDEINSLLGFCKVRAKGSNLKVNQPVVSLENILGQVQQDLFVVQAQLAGADKKISKEKIGYLEKIINGIEKEIPPIRNFIMSGGSELSALFDYSRAVARRIERRVLVLDEKIEKVDPLVIAYFKLKTKEETASYK